MRTGNPNWVKGKAQNPAGRPKGTKNKFSLAHLQRAMEKAKKTHSGQSLIESMCERAYTNDHVAIAILRKMLPDLRQVDAIVDVGTIGYACLTPEQACADMDAATIGTKPKSKNEVKP